MKIIILGLSLFLSSPFCVLAQSKSNKKQANTYYNKAIEFAEMSQTRDEAIDLLKKAKYLDPNNMQYDYQIAYLLYKQNKYQETIDYLGKFTFHENVTEQYFQLLGDAYKRLKKYDKAIVSLQDGLNRFPNSGMLFYEQGVVEYQRKDYKKAMYYWENGIKANPKYASNYYSLSKLLSYSDETVWSVLYGEAFMNLEPTTTRSEEMSSILYNTYKKSIHLTSVPVSVHFTKDAIVPFSVLKDSKISFPFMYGLSMAQSIAIESSVRDQKIDLETLNFVRQIFITNWYTEKKNKLYPNTLFDFQKTLEKKGFIEAYNYWLFMHGNKTEFQNWLSTHEDEFKLFVEWFKSHRAKNDKKNYFSRKKYV